MKKKPKATHGRKSYHRREKQMRKGPITLDLDEEYLGQRLGGNPEDRAFYLECLQEYYDDPEKGPEWLRSHKKRLLASAELVESMGL